MKNIRLVKNRSDIGAGTRGADMGIDAMEIAAINIENDFFNRIPAINVKTHNETIYNKVTQSFAKRIGFVVEQCNRVANTVQEVLQNKEFPLVLSGDHSSALGTISGLKAANPNAKLGVVWIDAHADLHSPYTSPSGNVHGMPLAAALQEDNMDMRINALDKDTINSWNQLKNIGTTAPKFLPEHLIYFGVRDTEAAENALIVTKNIKNYAVSEMRYRGIDVCLKEATDKLGDCDAIYITFDVDSLDCDYVSRGTGTPVSFGFRPDEIKHIITAFLKTDKVKCMEFTEVNPLLDNKANKMAETAFDVLNTCFNDFH
ncbi:arginase [Algibacter mikhailovii]|uniref:arginase n=1 Tax=Algibacter mikhailovii TaxID=425498 RepID=UPI002493E5C6|nr:arginase [Algibacter mikhailovii]